MNVSVIIPVFNRVDLLRQTLDSCAAQTLDRLEIVVVDDGSTEDVAGFVETWKQNLRPGMSLRLHRQESGGAPRARNAGAALATGDLLCFMDSDNVAAPEKLERLRDALLADPDAGAAYCLCEFFEHAPGDVGRLWNAPDERNIIDRFIMDDPIWDTCSVLWRRSAFEAAGQWNEEIGCWQDWELHLRAIAQSISFSYVPSVLQYYRNHDGPRISIEPEKRDRLVHSRLIAILSVWDALDANGELTTLRQESLAQMFVVRTVEAVDYAIEGLAWEGCARLLKRVSDPDLHRRLKFIQLRASVWFGSRAGRAKRFRKACIKQGWHADNVFPGATWGILDSGTYERPRYGAGQGCDDSNGKPVDGSDSPIVI